MTAQADIQTGWRTVMARVYARDVADTFSDFTRFKIGEGGHLAGMPKTPDPLLTDLESEGASKTGIVAFTTGSTIVTGSGTAFLTEFAAGEWIKPGALPSAFVNSAGVPGSEEDVWGQIFSVDSDTQITLTAVYAGGTYPLGDARVPKRQATDPMYTFRKTLAAGDVTLLSAVPAIFEVASVVGSTEANEDQQLNSPQFFELGIFDANGVMMAYMTMDQEIKIVGVQLNHVIQVTV